MNNSKEMFKCYELIRNELKKKDIEAVMRGKVWQRLMELMADHFNTISASAQSESDVATNIDAAILAFSTNVMEPSGQRSFEVNKERAVSIEKEKLTEEGRVKYFAKGKIDSKYSSVVIEYKQPSAYKTKADTDSAFYQALDYLNSLYNEKAGTYLGLVTDGGRCQFLVYNEKVKELYAVDKTKVSPLTSVRKLDTEMVDKLIKSIIKLRVKALTSDNLIHDLVETQKAGKNVIYHLTNALYNSLNKMEGITEVSYGQWMNNFGLSHDDASKQKAIQDRRRDLAELINREKIETDEEYKILFALQTSISILAMLIAYKVVLLVKRQEHSSFSDLLKMNMDERRIELGRIAEGAVSMELNVFNLLEIGCFSWPFSDAHWTEDINEYVKEIIEILMVYETMPDLTNRTDDLFRDLYMSILPVSVRHSLGEYYTPEWLAENVINSGLEYMPYDKEHIRIIDSTAGSGTFIQKVIEKKRKQYCESNNSEVLGYILNEVAAIDANTLAVILARINYFLSIADLVSVDNDIYIPVFIGDSSIPAVNKLSLDKKFYIDTIQLGESEKIRVEVPVSSTKDNKQFIQQMQNLTFFGDAEDTEFICHIDKLCENEMESNSITESWCELKAQGLITPAVINSMINSFMLCNIGKFDMVVGNPPWVDWKTLPSVHRENKKEVCYERNLFSGDGRTGGNSLNICALISNVTAENWLAKGGVMAILMPQSLLFQQSYEGYRNFELFDGRRLYFQEIVDWSKAGHPFSPVQQLFCTYIISENVRDYTKGIPLKHVVLNKGQKLEKIKNLISEKNFADYFTLVSGVVGKASESRSAFTYARDSRELAAFNTIAGVAGYIGREGVEYYPQELQLLTLKKANLQKNTVNLESYQSAKSKISVGKRTPELETKYLRPLIKGVNISRFHVDASEYIVAFPYDEEHFKVPINKGTLLEDSPKLLTYYEQNKQYLMAQTEYSDKIIGDDAAPYYALARTGKYSHAEWYVIFRDNTKWVSAVAGPIDTEWGGVKKPAFQNHCVSVCEREDGTFITEDEAHYICAILNSHIVEDYVLSTSDKRTFKIRIPVKIKAYNTENAVHLRLSELSKQAHDLYDDEVEVECIRAKIDKLYIQSLL